MELRRRQRSASEDNLASLLALPNNARLTAARLRTINELSRLKQVALLNGEADVAKLLDRARDLGEVELVALSPLQAVVADLSSLLAETSAGVRRLRGQRKGRFSRTASGTRLSALAEAATTAAAAPVAEPPGATFGSSTAAATCTSLPASVWQSPHGSPNSSSSNSPSVPEDAGAMRLAKQSSHLVAALLCLSRLSRVAQQCATPSTAAAAAAVPSDRRG